VYSTYLGDLAQTSGMVIALDGCKPADAYVTGSTSFGQLSARNPCKPLGTSSYECFCSGNKWRRQPADLFHIPRWFIDPMWRTELPVDSGANAYVAGRTASANFLSVSGGAAGHKPLSGQLGHRRATHLCKISPTARQHSFLSALNNFTRGLGGSIGFATERLL